MSVWQVEYEEYIMDNMGIGAIRVLDADSPAAANLATPARRLSRRRANHRTGDETMDYKEMVAMLEEEEWSTEELYTHTALAQIAQALAAERQAAALERIAETLEGLQGGVTDIVAVLESVRGDNYLLVDVVDKDWESDA